MSKKPFPKYEKLTFEKIIPGGQALSQGPDGRKIFAWNVLPGETVNVQVTKKKSSYMEAIATSILEPSSDRIEPKDPDSYLSTSPWQIMRPEIENHYKSALVEEAFEQHDVVLPHQIETFGDDVFYEYRSKIEFSFWYDTEQESLDLAFFQRGTHGKIAVQGTSLARPEINATAQIVLDILRARKAEGRALKTLLIRSSKSGDVAFQLYVKDEAFEPFSPAEMKVLEKTSSVVGFEVIFSNPQSPASVITRKIQGYGQVFLSDTILGVNFSYAIDGFFQINIPVYEQALRDMKQYILPELPVVDLYSGVGSIGLTITDGPVKLIEINESAVREMRQNILALGRENSAEAILSDAAKALEYIVADATIIVDPPRAGLHEKVVQKILEMKPKRVIYLSCNPATQARDCALLCAEKSYGIQAHRGYNFFPRTPHIEHLLVLDRM